MSSIFGQTQPAPGTTGGGLFGSVNTASQPQQSGGLFGSATPPPAQSGALYGSKTAQPAQRVLVLACSVGVRLSLLRVEDSSDLLDPKQPRVVVYLSHQLLNQLRLGACLEVSNLSKVEESLAAHNLRRRAAAFLISHNSRTLGSLVALEPPLSLSNNKGAVSSAISDKLHNSLNNPNSKVVSLANPAFFKIHK